MARLIDVDEAIEKAEASDEKVGSSVWETCEVMEFLNDCDIVDAVEVVRCKDCWYHRSDGLCEGGHDIRAGEYADFYTDDEDFCSKGVRR